MTISRLTVDKLGVKLYDRVSAVLAELVANSYDADATRVEIVAPMGEYLATKDSDRVVDKGYEIIVRDDGVGMTPDQVNEFYLKVGAERRRDPRRGDRSPVFGRKVMGRKGVGKLAPFGICERIELLSSGGVPVSGLDREGNPTSGYLTAHLVLSREKILSDTDELYAPETGTLDGTVSPSRGTTLTLSGFGYRYVPDIEELDRQLAQRFGLRREDWAIELVDVNRGASDPDRTRIVGAFSIDTMDNTVLRLEGTQVIGPDNKPVDDLKSGFEVDGRFYPVTGWIGYSKNPYRDDLMAGIRIYCRGKIAAQTGIFNRRAGFTGEHDVRSYLVGEMHADWLDEDEDLIQTDRRDILWSHELGQAFEKWGQSLVVRIGRASRQPMKKKAWQQFLETSDLPRLVDDAFPSQIQQPIRENAIEIAKMVAETMRDEELQDQTAVRSVVNLSLLFAPHLTLDRKLREAADHESPLEAVTGVLQTARIAELSSFGRIAEDRVKVIERVEVLKGDATLQEEVYQELIENAPWLIDPQWAPITANQRFSTLRRAFENYYRERTGEEIHLDPFSQPLKRSDFVLSNQDQTIHIIEIKRPGHRFENDEMTRLNRYHELMNAFLEEPNNAEFNKIFPEYHLTLVCDGERLTGVYKTAFEALQREGKLTYINWETFLLRTRKMHESFLEEAERQRRDAAKTFA
jgi:hypothetical protein